jgi:tetratricopeptide (TPR) repeat protein
VTGRPRRSANHQSRRRGAFSEAIDATASSDGRLRRPVGTTGGGSIISALTQEDHRPATTSGVIAVANLHAQIDGLARAARARTGNARPAVPERALLIDLLLLRGHVLGRVADYERAAELAGQLVRDVPDNGTALLARARTRGTFHRFAKALADLDTAGACGTDRATLDGERAGILLAVGRDAEAAVLLQSAAERRPDFTNLGALAVLEAARGQVGEAEELFARARSRYRGVSPFPVASLDFRRGLMWLGRRDLTAARAWFDAARRRVPAYAPALGHLAEVDAALGALGAAIDRLHPLAVSSDDPEYAATLADVLDDAGRPLEAEHWRAIAASRYDELVSRHPEAFADHAADFRGSVAAARRTRFTGSHSG